MARDTAISSYTATNASPGIRSRSAIQKLLMLCILFTMLISCYCKHALANSITLGQSRITLSASVSTAAPKQSFWLMLHIKMPSGWHTYWKNPGDSGLAPEFIWDSNHNITIKAAQYQTPEYIQLGNIINIGYKDDAYFLFPATIPKISELPTNIILKASWLICKDECIPQQANLQLMLNTGTQSIASQARDKILQQLTQIPKTHAQADQQPIKFRSQKQYIELIIPRQAFAIDQQSRVSFFPLQSDVIKNYMQQSGHISGNNYNLNLSRDFAHTPKTLHGILTISQQNDSSTIRHSFAISAQIQHSTWSHALLKALAFALLGGIILNAMPCVFPILALKALSISHASQAKYKHHLWHGTCYSIGVVLSFFGLALLLVILKSFGHNVGWGFQMQSPTLIAILVYLFLLIALNFAGYFEISSGIMGIGQGLTQQAGARGSFFTGVLAAIVATPCSAPFMGTAIGYALVQPTLISLCILTTLGIGMALPLFAISAIPRLGRLLPKPGAWMQTLQQALAFPMLLACAWLLWVYIQQSTIGNVMWLLIGMVMLAFSIWLWQQLALVNRIGKYITALCLLALCSLPLWITYHTPANAVNTKTAATTTTQAVGSQAIEAQTTGAQAFSQHKLDALLASKQVVLVNATAAWCLTCKYNESMYFSSARFKNFIAQHGIHYLVADWTQRDRPILTFLQSFQRDGVPLYVLYNRQGKATVLPQMLTANILYKALENAMHNHTPAAKPAN